MNIEEKAKAYDEAIQRAKSLLSGNQLGNAWIYKLLHELKESEDEKIRKGIIYGLNYLERELSWDFVGNVDILDAYAWLEKQGELSNKMKIQQDDIKATDEELILFYRWLNDHELQCQRDEDAGSAELFASIKSMFIEVFGKWITKKN